MVRIWVYQHDVCFLEKQADCCGAGDCNCRGDARVLFAMQYDGGSSHMRKPWDHGHKKKVSGNDPHYHLVI